MTADSRSPRPINKPREGSYADLYCEIRQAGLFEPRTLYYVAKITSNAVGMVSAWTVFLLLGDSWWQLMTAVFLAFMFGQSAIIGHDTGHQQISRSRLVNFTIGYLHMDLATGLSFSWWVERHRRHHTYPNHEGRDPDIINGLLVLTPSQLGERASWRRWISRYQALLFYPVLFLVQSFAMHINHIRRVLRSHNRHMPVEAALLSAHFALYATVVILVLSPIQAIIFVLMQQGLFGVYMGSIIAPNHKGMRIIANAQEVTFLVRQLSTSRNIRGGWLTESVFGGLNHQIEHHLFPAMPIPNLRRAGPIVRAFCLRYDLPYTEVGFLESYGQALSFLHNVGRNHEPNPAAA